MLRRLAFLALLGLPLAGCGQIPMPGAADQDADTPAEVDKTPKDGADATGADATGGNGDTKADAAGADADGEAEEQAAYPGGASDEEPAEDAARSGSDSLSASSADGPAPADMLNADELERAAELALGSGELRSMAAGAVDRASLADEAAEGDLEALSIVAERPSYRLLYTQRLAAPKGEDQGRAAEVAVYRYDTGTLERSKVDLATGKVEALAADPGLPAPLVPEEILEAAAVARAAGEVQAALREAGLDPATAKVNGILTVSTEDGSVCASKRCVRLFFATERQPLPSFNVVVNLNDLSLVEVQPMPGFEEAQP